MRVALEMVVNIDHNQKGALLEELAVLEPQERRAKLHETVDGIHEIIASSYADAKSLDKLEYELANYESLWKDELIIISRGVKEELKNNLDQHPDYDKDTVNQVFIGLYRELIERLDGTALNEVVDYDRVDNMNKEFVEVIDLINIYHVLSEWVTLNNRSVDGLNENETSKATKQFRDLKNSARNFVHSFRSLLRQGYNIESAYEYFTANKNLETYISGEKVIEDTKNDCKGIVSSSKVKGNGTEIIRKLAHTIEMNAESYFLEMGYEMLHDSGAKQTLPYPEKFKGELLKNAFDTSKTTYLSVMPPGNSTIDQSIRTLPLDVRAFYGPAIPK